jgi:hypothetical protein
VPNTIGAVVHHAAIHGSDADFIHPREGVIEGIDPAQELTGLTLGPGVELVLGNARVEVFPGGTANLLDSPGESKRERNGSCFTAHFPALNATPG